MSTTYFQKVQGKKKRSILYQEEGKWGRGRKRERDRDEGGTNVQIYQNFNIWGSYVKGVWVLMLVFLQLFCTFEYFRIKTLGRKK